MGAKDAGADVHRVAALLLPVQYAVPREWPADPMILDDIYEELRSYHSVPLQDLDGLTLRSILVILKRIRAERADHGRSLAAANEKVTLLRVLLEAWRHCLAMREPHEPG